MAAKKAAKKTAPRRKKSTAKGGIKRILNCLPSPKQENDWTFRTALSVGLTARAAIPTSRDLREPWWTINDQGSTGSCVGWASADSVLRWHFVKAGRLDKAKLLSPRFP